MNILIVITKGEVGGAQIFVSTLAKNLHRQGHKVTVACGEGDYLRDTLMREHISVVRFHSLQRTKNPLTNFAFGLELRAFLKKHPVDVVHFNSSNALFGAIGTRLLRHRPKIVFTVHGLSLVDPNYTAPKPAKLFYRLLFKFLLSLVGESVFVSKANLDYAKKIRLLKHGTVIPNGIDTGLLAFLSREEARATLAEKTRTDLSNNYLIGSIGRLAYPKNYEFLINTFPDILKEIPNAKAVIIGEGPKRETYAQMIEQKNLSDKIFLVGELPDAYRYIKAFNLFALPSEYEGMSMTLIEALFAEVPILASRVGGTPELLNEAAWTYELNNTEEFIKKTLALHAQKNFTYTEAQKNHRSRFEGKAMANAYLKVYE